MEYLARVQVSFYAVIKVVAEDDDLAEKKIKKKLMSECLECSPCIHGSYFTDHELPENELLLEDGQQIDIDFDSIEVEEI